MKTPLGFSGGPWRGRVRWGVGPRPRRDAARAEGVRRGYLIR